MIRTTPLRRSFQLVPICLLLALGCQTPSAEPDVIAEMPMHKLPVSHNEVMVALVNHAADPIWVAAWRSPQDEGDWRELERLSYQLKIAGVLLEMPGTGPMDEEWAGDENWVRWAGELSASGQQALEAAQARDTSLVGAAGDRIVEACEGCHSQFKPDLPTSGLFGELSPNEADFEEEG